MEKSVGIWLKNLHKSISMWIIKWHVVCSIVIINIWQFRAKRPEKCSMVILFVWNWFLLYIERRNRFQKNLKEEIYFFMVKKYEICFRLSVYIYCSRLIYNFNGNNWHLKCLDFLPNLPNFVISHNLSKFCFVLYFFLEYTLQHRFSVVVCFF